MKLNARQVDTARGTDKPYKLADGGGLYLLVNPNGARYWRLKYRAAGKEKLLAVGVYPDVSLADARRRRDEAKKILAAGGDPGQEKQAEKQARVLAVQNSFEAIAPEWHEHKQQNWSAGYAADILEYLSKDIFPLRPDGSGESEGCITFVNRADFYTVRQALLHRRKNRVPGSPHGLMAYGYVDVQGDSDFAKCKIR